MKIIDCFIFYNELDMLKYRLNILNKYVDFFVIVECKYTFSGKEKKLFFEENKEVFEPFNDKIIHVVLNDIPYKYPNIDYEKKQQWDNESFNRNGIKIGINRIANVLTDNDIIVLSDVDEIPDPLFLKKIKDKELIIRGGISLKQDFYYYNLNTKHLSSWYSSKMMTVKGYKILKKSFQDLRDYKFKKTNIVCGWHLSYFGDAEFIKNKIQNFSHQEYNNNSYTNTDYIKEKVSKQIDLYGRNDVFLQISTKLNNYLPPEYDKYMSSYVLY